MKSRIYSYKIDKICNIKKVFKLSLPKYYLIALQEQFSNHAKKSNCVFQYIAFTDSHILVVLDLTPTYTCIEKSQ